MSFNNSYFEYLSTRSLLGYIYRKYWLYPKLNTKLIGKTLDVGCGIGDFLKFRRYTYGVDIDPNAIKYCKAKGLNVSLICNNKISFSDNFFDSVILDNVLEHIENPKPLLLEISRILKLKGILLIGVPGDTGFRSDLDHKVFYSENFLKLTLEKVGFECQEVFAMPLPFALLSKIVKSYCIYGVFIKK
jgi:SAM-dependent methyltransferase